MEINDKNEKIGTYVGLAITVVIFQFFAPHIFEGPTEKGLDTTQLFFAALTGGFGGVLGKFFVKTFGKKTTLNTQKKAPGEHNMFLNLAKYETERTGKEAVGFYLAYLFLGLMLGFATGFIAGALNPENVKHAAFVAGGIFSVVYCVTLAILIAVKKSQTSSFQTLLIIGITAIASIFLGALGGLIPVAYLTTIPNKNVYPANT
jgi:H+/Cl- antiporter ClcA